MGDAAYIILSSDSRKNTGNYYIVNNLFMQDDEVLRKAGVKCLKKYQIDPSIK
jgi:hypothetical protein